MECNMAICWKLSKIPTGNWLDYGDNQQGRPQEIEEPSETTRHAPNYWDEDIVRSPRRRGGCRFTP